MTVQLYAGDCLEIMPTLSINSIDSIVCDPPYGLSFMGKAWDHGVPGVAFWEAALKVAKPGAMLLAFGGTRTFHRLTCAIEDAGWEVRDCLMWVFGSGFPKSLDQSKAIQGVFLREFLGGVRRLKHTNGDCQDYCCGNCRQCGEPLHSAAMDAANVAPLQAAAPSHSHLYEPLDGTHQGNGHKDTAFYVGLSDHLSKRDFRGQSTFDAWQLIQEVSSFLCPVCFARLIEDASPGANQQGDIRWSNIDALSVAIAWGKSETFFRSMRMLSEPYNHYITTMERFKGYGSALKPAYEPIIMARKPLSEPTIAQNVLRWGTGGLNIDATRIGTDEVLHAGAPRTDKRSFGKGGTNGDAGMFDPGRGSTFEQHPQGRWPANLCLDEEAAAMLDEQKHSVSRFFYVPKASKRDRDEGLEGMPLRPSYMVENGSKTSGLNGERYERTTQARNHHPTVKSTALMRWLVRLVTPPNGTVLDCFAGSGSTGKAACLEGFSFVGIEIDSDYIEIARQRIQGVS